MFQKKLFLRNFESHEAFTMFEMLSICQNLADFLRIFAKTKYCGKNSIALVRLSVFMQSAN